MIRIKDRKLKKRAKKEQPKHKIQYKSLLVFGMKDTKENRTRWTNGEALDLMVEAIEAEENELNIRHDPVANKIDVKFLEEQEKAQDDFLEQYKDTE